METRYAADPVRFKTMTTEEVRENFLIENLFKADEIVMVYSNVDRAIAGSACPVSKALTLGTADELRADFFCQRRELGVLNIGQTGKVTVDGTEYEMANRDGLYVGMGAKEIRFESADSATPAEFYLISYPAHQSYPTTHARKADAAAVNLGSEAQSNKRTIFKYIHPEGIKSCQLVMGFTELATGSVWNTMPAHTHARRMEVYLYFGMDENDRVFHMMGEPTQTRHIVTASKQAVISPSWSIHSGVGTGAYTFCWGMGGENQTFDDMDAVGMDEIR